MAKVLANSEREKSPKGKGRDRSRSRSLVQRAGVCGWSVGQELRRTWVEISQSVRRSTKHHKERETER